MAFFDLLNFRELFVCFFEFLAQSFFFFLYRFDFFVKRFFFLNQPSFLTLYFGTAFLGFLFGLGNEPVGFVFGFQHGFFPFAFRRLHRLVDNTRRFLCCRADCRLGNLFTMRAAQHKPEHTEYHCRRHRCDDCNKYRIQKA